MSNFQPLEFVDRGSETQIQVGENFNCIFLPSTSCESFTNIQMLT